jgi:hypothetical protein
MKKEFEIDEGIGNDESLETQKRPTHQEKRDFSGGGGRRRKNKLTGFWMDGSRRLFFLSFSLALVCGLGYPQESLREPTKTFSKRLSSVSLSSLPEEITRPFNLEVRAHEGGSTKPIRKEEEREELFAVGETREIPQ